MLEQFCQPIDYRKTKPKAAPRAPGLTHLYEIPEDLPQLLFGNPAARIPDLDAHTVAAPATADQNATVVREFDGIQDEISQNPSEQLRIASHSDMRRQDREARPFSKIVR